MTNKLKILYINGSFKNGSGCESFAHRTMKIMTEHGHICEYFTTEGETDDLNYKYGHLFVKKYDTPLLYIKNIFKYYYNWESQNNINIILNDFQPDLVHVHSLRYSSMTYAVLKPIIEKKIPIVMTLHDCFLVCPMLTLMKGNKEWCKDVKCKGYNKFNCLLNNCGLNGIEQSLRLSILSFINKITKYDKSINKFITPSNALRDLIIKNDKDINANKIVTINNFLEQSIIENTTPNYENKNYFLYIGRLSKEKGVHYLLQSLKELSQNIELHIIGKGPEEEYLKSFVKNNNLTNVKFLGFINDAQVKEEFKHCIASILPCNWFENFPQTNLESFINGKPVIASNVGGIPEQVIHNINGLLFEPGNIEQLKECLLIYLNNPNLVIQHGKNAYKKAITQYTEERYYKNLVKIYEELLK